VVLVHLLRQYGRLLVRIEGLEARGAVGGVAPSENADVAAKPAQGLPVGTPAPDFSLPGLYGETLTLEALRAPGKPVMLLFTDPGCGPCTALLPEIRGWQKEHAEKLTISLVSRGSSEANRAKSTEHGLRGVLLQKDWEVAEAYQVWGTPSAVLVRPDGVIGSPVAGGPKAIEALVAQAAGDPTQPPVAQGEPCPNCGKVHAAGNGHAANGHAANGHAAGQAVPATRKIGTPAPPIKLADLEGNSVKLRDFRGKKTLVLFWNPGCGFCQQMLDDLKDWEADPPEGAPKALVVSAGTVEANKAMGLSSRVVLDQQFAAGRAFGTSGTPSAVLVDERGKIASEVAVGAPAVLALAGAREAQV
jgi:peroxiredoxin